MANFIPEITYDAGAGLVTVTLTHPPEADPRGENRKPFKEVATGSTGVRQTNRRYLEETRNIKLTFLSETELNALRTLFDDHASFGGEFSYFESNDEAAFTTVSWDGDFKPKILTGDGSGGHIYELSLKLRRVVS